MVFLLPPTFLAATPVRLQLYLYHILSLFIGLLVGSHLLVRQCFPRGPGEVRLEECCVGLTKPRPYMNLVWS